MTFQRVGIIGAGAWGTALALTARRAGRDVRVWAFEPEVVEEINGTHGNPLYLPDIELDPAIRATSSFETVADADFLLMVPPAQHLRDIGKQLAPHVKRGRPILIGAKGIEQSSGTLLSAIAAEVLPQAEVGVLSGPSFAEEVARGLPAALTLATPREELGRALSHALSHTSFRCYWSDDVVGAEIGGALKNVYAIAAGIVAGKKLGDSAHAALVTRSFAEMARFGAALGARRETLTGLSGLGDLILTCGSPQSRNMSLGIALGQGQDAKAVLSARRSVTEGVYTACAVAGMSAARDLDMPIARAVYAVTSGRATVDQAVGALLARPLRAEA
jgi:glycerol-3-phosphate dehydrogenase (NAD(P)+)